MRNWTRLLSSAALFLAFSSPPAFAQTYTDDFNRSNGDNLGSSWVEKEDSNCTSTLQILSNNARTTNCSGAYSYWNNSFPNNQYSKVQYNSGVDDGGRDIGGPVVRASTGGSWNSATLYMLEYDRSNSKFRILKYVNQSLSGSGTQVGADASGSLSTGDWLEIRASGTTITGFKNGTSLLSVTDSSISSGMFRFRNLHAPRQLQKQMNPGVEPRLNQIFSPLLSMISNEDTRSAVRDLASVYNRELSIDRETDIEAQVLQAIKDLLAAPAKARLAIGDITVRFTEKFGDEYERRITEKWIGSIVRKKLKLKTHRVQGVFVIPPTEEFRLKLLFERYGLVDGTGDIVDLVDVA